MVLAKQQKGMTFISLVILFIFIGMLALAGLRIFPLYYENNGMNKALEGFVEEYNDKPSMTINEMRHALQRRMDAQEVFSVKANDIEIKKSRNGYTIDASYKPVTNYVGNLSFMLEFEHILTLEK
ncbi:MAG: DUF4845 domain-containing protein [Gammaproteobacteria bacterium]|nr:DUF4845 domain-containing protein [Gammaproteobacteria bacterium]NNC96551.1 DUF4845 domain-containing protein [Gammaproteobacteria bacterium]NNM12910.1 DUF4845 domain-containing protein [Gammaproteobacteria bacterium]